MLDQSDLPRREAVLISDFQRAGWHGGEAVRLPAGAALRTIDVSNATSDDIAVTGVDVRRSIANGREVATLSARVANKSKTAVPDRALHLVVNRRELETKHARLEANGAATVEFAAIAIRVIPC